MCKRKITIGVLICSTSMLQTFGMEVALMNLTNSLQSLSAVWQPAVVQPIPPAPQPPLVVPMPPVPQPAVVVAPVPPVITVTPNTPAVVPPVPGPFIPIAPTPPAPPAPKPLSIAPKPPVAPGLSDLTNVKLNKPDDSKKPEVCPAPAGQTVFGINAADLLKRKDQRDKTAADRKQKAGGAISDRFLNSLFSAYPDAPTMKNPILSKDFNVEKESVNAIGIKSNTIMNQLKSNLFTQEDKRDRQPLAKKLLNGLLFYVRNNQVQPDQIKQISDVVVYILNIDPLLITTADVIFRQLGFSEIEIHSLMIRFFEERIRFIRETLEELKKQANEGAIQDIDEAFAYALALTGELARQESMLLDEHSTPAEKQEAQRFINRIKELRKELCEVITAPDNIILFNTKPALQALYRMICGKQQKNALRVYCISAEHTYGAVLAGKKQDVDYTYCGFDQEIKKIMEEIDAFKAIAAHEMSVSQRVYTVQTIISSLEDINTFFSNPDVCPNCLRRAIVSGHPGARQSSDVSEPFKQQLASIGDFLREINKRDNSFYLEEFVRNGIPNIKGTLERVRKLDDRESSRIYDLIQINRDRKVSGLPPHTLESYTRELNSK